MRQASALQCVSREKQKQEGLFQLLLEASAADYAQAILKGKCILVYCSLHTPSGESEAACKAGWPPLAVGLGGQLQYCHAFTDRPMLDHMPTGVCLVTHKQA